MSITNLNPYLNFNGDADKAIKLYEKALGAKAENVMRWGDMPQGEGGQVKPEHKNRVMHALFWPHDRRKPLSGKGKKWGDLRPRPALRP